METASPSAAVASRRCAVVGDKATVAVAVAASQWLEGGEMAAASVAAASR